jgi:hypothetical protein
VAVVECMEHGKDPKSTPTEELIVFVTCAEPLVVVSGNNRMCPLGCGEFPPYFLQQCSTSARCEIPRTTIFTSSPLMGADDHMQHQVTRCQSGLMSGD